MFWDGFSQARFHPIIIVAARFVPIMWHPITVLLWAARNTVLAAAPPGAAAAGGGRAQCLKLCVWAFYTRVVWVKGTGMLSQLVASTVTSSVLCGLLYVCVLWNGVVLRRVGWSVSWVKTKLFHSILLLVSEPGRRESSSLVLAAPLCVPRPDGPGAAAGGTPSTLCCSWNAGFITSILWQWISCACCGGESHDIVVLVFFSPIHGLCLVLFQGVDCACCRGRGPGGYGSCVFLTHPRDLPCALPRGGPCL